jgi:DNA-binding transcriptional MerR regulator
MPYKDLLIDLLLDKGFSVDEAEQLISLRERFEEQQAQEESHRNFARWLIKHGRLDEFKDV